ncbi:ABC transporter [Rhodococcus sp. MEB064]|nr:ABC transporter [Rhodococcus sp. MEB064]
MTALAVAFSVIGSLIPVAGALQIVAIVPLAVVAQRHRIRALAVAGTAGVLVSFVAGGFGTALTMTVSTVLAGIVGVSVRRGRGFGSVLTLSLVAGAVVGGLSVLMLLLLSGLRELFLAVLENSIRGSADIVGTFAPAEDVATAVADYVSFALGYWWILVFVSGMISTAVSGVVAWWVLRATLTRLGQLETRGELPDVVDIDTTAPQPVPVRLTGVTFRYRGAQDDALGPLDLTVVPGRFVAVVGANGSGKSTLARILVGAEPTGGQVERYGRTGLGLVGGTAMILQHPEAQILGTRVADDVVWGLPTSSRPTPERVEELLTEVGLAEYGLRDTGSLSGGELQRLAVAAALAREPKLLVADEATAMIDPQGQRELVELLAALPRRHAMAVVLITHRATEAALADDVVRLHRGRRVMHDPTWMSSAPFAGTAPFPAPGPPQLVLRGVGHVYNRRGPWATRALQNVDLTVHRGEGLLVIGGNGSGKSTLAWIMAGLTSPTEGTCELAGKSTSSSIGTVALSFQHARLQLQRRTVSEDIEAAGGSDVGTIDVSRVLDQVGLDRRLAGARIDELSGGQMRRVALAGLLVGKPEILVLDEPLAGLDPPGRREITALLAHLRRTGLTLVIISHDVDTLASVRSRTVTLDHGTLQVESAAGVIR